MSAAQFWGTAKMIQVLRSEHPGEPWSHLRELLAKETSPLLVEYAPDGAVVPFKIHEDPVGDLRVVISGTVEDDCGYVFAITENGVPIKISSNYLEQRAQ